MFTALREIQIPLLAAMLLGACAAKLARVLHTRSVAVALGPTALFPLNLRRPVAMAMCATEMALGAGLIVTAGRAGAGLPATAVRLGTATLFVIATAALIELRQRRPDIGCGCFGDLSSAPVSLRTISRSVLLVLAAALSIGAAPIRLQPPGATLALWVLMLAGELAVIAALSPEIGAALVRLGYSEPCELRVLPVTRTLSALHSSRQWRRHRVVLTSHQPVDIWRELCWRYVVYPGRYDGLEVEVVFAIYLRSRRPPVRAAIVDTATGATLPPPAALPPSARPIHARVAAGQIAADQVLAGQLTASRAAADRAAAGQAAADQPAAALAARGRPAAGQPVASLAAAGQAAAGRAAAGQRALSQAAPGLARSRPLAHAQPASAPPPYTRPAPARVASSRPARPLPPNVEPISSREAVSLASRAATSSRRATPSAGPETPAPGPAPHPADPDAPMDPEAGFLPAALPERPPRPSG